MYKELLGLVTDRLKGSTELAAYVEGRIYNFVKQECLFPFVRYRLTDSAEFDTKTEIGLDVELRVDVWSLKQGDLQVMEMLDIIKPLFHRNEFTGATFQNIVMNYESHTSFIEPDGETTHGLITFRTFLQEL